MNLRKLFGGVLFLALVMGVALPNPALAQEQGTDRGGFSLPDISGLLGGLNNDSAAPNSTNPSNNSWTNWFGGNTSNTPNTAPAPTNNGMVSGLLRLFGFGAVDPASAPTDPGSPNNTQNPGFSLPGFGNSSGNGSSGGTLVGDAEAGAWVVLDAFRAVFWDNVIVETIGNVGEAVIAEGVTFLDNTFNNSGVTSDEPSIDSPAGAQTGGTFQNGSLGPNPVPTGGYAEVRKDPVTGKSYTTVYDENGNAVRSNDPKYAGQTKDKGQTGGSGGPSIPGASKGTVGNPFSDGSDKDDAPSSNKEDTSNPYLFEYDPSSTNNNPAGDGAMEN